MEGDDSHRDGMSTSRRVVSGPGGGGRSPWLAVVVVATLVGVGVVLTRADSEPAPSSRDDQAGESPPTGAEMEVTEAADASAAYAEAAVRFSRAHTFGYRGTVRSAGPSLLRPGPWIAAEVSVEGAVHLPLSITTEVAVDSTGAAAETVTSGPATWARRAPARDGLAAAPWVAVGGEVSTEAGRLPPGVPTSRLGIALVADAIQAATDRRDGPSADAEHRVIRATVHERPSRSTPRLDDLDDLIGGSELAVTLDDGGDIVRVVLTSAPGQPTLEIALDIVRLGDPALVTAGALAEPIGASVPPDVLADVGLAALDVPGLPTTWALTSAWVHRPDGSLSPLPPGCGGPVLVLVYHDLRAEAAGLLSLSVRRDTCDPDEGTGVETGEGTEVPVDAGRFTGSASLTPGQTYQGDVTDGTTAVSFTTDLSPEAAAAALASLVPG